MSVSEAEVLKPIDSAISDSDEWPVFLLSEAYVSYERNNKPASLLAAYADAPLRVRGRLEGPERGQTKYFLKKPYRPIDIELRDVTRFSYGETTDGSYVIWALGKAGWFEIQPAERYRPIFHDMLQAVALLYFATDIYAGAREQGDGGSSAASVFKKYAKDKRFPSNDITQAEKIFHSHRIFLIMSFFNRDQTVDWGNTSLYKHFKERYCKDFEACRARVEACSLTAQLQQDSRTSEPSSVAVTKSAAMPLRSDNAHTKTPDVNGPPKKDNNWWEAAALFEFIQKAVNQRALHPERNQITLKRIAELIVRYYEIEELEVAQNVLLVHAQNLCYMISRPKRKSSRCFVSEPFYQELAVGCLLSPTEQQKAKNVVLRPRKDRANLRDGDASSSDTPKEDEEVIATPVRRRPGHRRKGRLSVLRPKSSEYSGKGKGKGKSSKGKAPCSQSTVPSDHSEGHESENKSSDENEVDLNIPMHVFSPAREKRKLNEVEGDEEEEQSRRKRAASTPATPESPASTDSEEDQETFGSLLPLRSVHTNGLSSSIKTSASTLISPLISTPLPTYTSNGPRDSWICSFDGCSQRIYGCSKSIGQQLITEHLEDHSKGRAKVMGIVWREQDKLNLPVSNLIRKIREMTDISSPLFAIPGSEKNSSRPIRRAL